MVSNEEFVVYCNSEMCAVFGVSFYQGCLLCIQSDIYVSFTLTGEPKPSFNGFILINISFTFSNQRLLCMCLLRQ